MITFELDGKSKNFLRTADKIIVGGVSKGLKPAADVVVKEAKRRAPVRTGRLRASIDSTVNRDMISIEASVNYAAFVEYGTRGRSPQPFLNPAAEGSMNEVETIIMRSISDEWERA